MSKKYYSALSLLISINNTQVIKPTKNFYQQLHVKEFPPAPIKQFLDVLYPERASDYTG